MKALHLTSAAVRRMSVRRLSLRRLAARAGGVVALVAAVLLAAAPDVRAQQVAAGDEPIINTDVSFSNVFTPNGDGINDLFQPVVGNMADYTVQVYDRTGREVFVGNPTKLWDGNVNGSAVPIGVYVYLFQGITTDGRPITHTSSLVLLR